MKRDRAAEAWCVRMEAAARRVDRPLVARFPMVPRACRRTGCPGPHVAPGLMVTPKGEWYYVPSEHGFHSRETGPLEPIPLTWPRAVRAARALLARMRRHDPWAVYPDVAEVADHDPDKDPGPPRVWL